MGKTILNELQTTCPFPEVFEETEVLPGSSFPVPVRKIGHIRSDFDGYRWWSTIWYTHRELETPAICKEIDKVYDRLTGKGTFKDLAALRKFCYAHPEAQASENDRTEYNFYFQGQHANYWIRCITRRGDYNLYLNAFTKADKQEG